MVEVLRINTQKALHDPASVFGSPEALASEIALTRGQKIATLQRWEEQVCERLAAAGSELSHLGAPMIEADLLEAIRSVRENLKLGAPAG